MNNINWQFKHFSELTTDELYKILTLRNEIFVVEQNCVYLDTDDKDLDVWHLFGSIEEQVIAYARIIPPGISYDTASIGRVVVNQKYRSNGIGYTLMKLAINETLNQFSVNTITISAQEYLLKFYSSLGFVQISEPYLEDDIPHVKMIYKNNESNSL